MHAMTSIIAFAVIVVVDSGCVPEGLKLCWAGCDSPHCGANTEDGGCNCDDGYGWRWNGKEQECMECADPVCPNLDEIAESEENVTEEPAEGNRRLYESFTSENSTGFLEGPHFEHSGAAANESRRLGLRKIAKLGGKKLIKWGKKEAKSQAKDAAKDAALQAFEDFKNNGKEGEPEPASDDDKKTVEKMGNYCVREGWFQCQGGNQVDFGEVGLGPLGRCDCCDGFGWFYNEEDPEAEGCWFGWCCAYCGDDAPRASRAPAHNFFGATLLLIMLSLSFIS